MELTLQKYGSYEKFEQAGGSLLSKLESGVMLGST